MSGPIIRCASQQRAALRKALPANRSPDARHSAAGPGTGSRTLGLLGAIFTYAVRAASKVLQTALSKSAGLRPSGLYRTNARPGPYLIGAYASYATANYSMRTRMADLPSGIPIDRFEGMVNRVEHLVCSREIPTATRRLISRSECSATSFISTICSSEMRNPIPNPSRVNPAGLDQ